MARLLGRRWEEEEAWEGVEERAGVVVGDVGNEDVEGGGVGGGDGGRGAVWDDGEGGGAVPSNVTTDVPVDR